MTNFLNFPGQFSLKKSVSSLFLLLKEKQTMDQFLILGLNIFAWITILLLIFKFLMLYTGKLSSDLVSFICVAVLLITGTLTEEQGLAGFGSNSVITLGVLLHADRQ